MTKRKVTILIAATSVSVHKDDQDRIIDIMNKIADGKIPRQGTIKVKSDFNDTHGESYAFINLAANPAVLVYYQ